MPANETDAELQGGCIHRDGSDLTCQTLSLAFMYPAMALIVKKLVRGQARLEECGVKSGCHHAELNAPLA